MQDGAIRHGQNVIIVDDLIATGAFIYSLHIDTLLSLLPKAALPVRRAHLSVCRVGTSWSTCSLLKYLHCGRTGPSRILFIRSFKNNPRLVRRNAKYIYCWAPVALF